MNPGDIYWFNVPYEESAQAKPRPVVILQLFDDNPEDVAVIESTSKEKPGLELIHTIDFDAPRYYFARLKGLYGVSRFYAKRARVRSKSLQLDRIGALFADDILHIRRKLNLL